MHLLGLLVQAFAAVADDVAPVTADVLRSPTQTIQRCAPRFPERRQPLVRYFQGEASETGSRARRLLLRGQEQAAVLYPHRPGLRSLQGALLSSVTDVEICFQRPGFLAPSLLLHFSSLTKTSCTGQL